MSINKTAMLLLLGALTVLSGCSVMDEKLDDANRLVQSEMFAVPPNQQSSDKNSVPPEDALSGKQTVYFSSRNSEVERSFIPIIEKQSQNLLDNADYTLVLEGHADERGSREYNIALAEERAKVVAKMLQAHGVQLNQLKIVSYGEEKPASHEHNETSSYLNQRVNLIFQRTQK